MHETRAAIRLCFKVKSLTVFRRENAQGVKSKGKSIYKYRTFPAASQAYFLIFPNFVNYVKMLC